MTTPKIWLLAGLLCLMLPIPLGAASEEQELVAKLPVFPARALVLQARDSRPNRPVLVWDDHLLLRAHKTREQLLVSTATGRQSLDSMAGLPGALGIWMRLEAVDGLVASHGALGGYAEAEPLLKEALATREGILGSGHVRVVASHNHLALAYQLQGKVPEAEAAYQLALSAAEQLSERSAGWAADNLLSAALNNLATLRQSQGDFAGAAALYQRGLKILKPAATSQDSRYAVPVAAALNNLAIHHLGQERYAKAESLLRLALDKFADHPHAIDALRAVTLNNLAELYRRRGMNEEAERFFEQSLSTVEASLGPDHLHTAIALEGYALLLRQTGRDADAEPFEARAKAIRAGNAGQN